MKTLFLVLIFSLSAVCAAERPVLFIGDSITFGVREGVTVDDTFVRKMDGINAGVPGNTSRDGLSRLPALLQQHNPKKVFIMFGINDCLNNNLGCTVYEFKDNLKKMINLCKANGSSPIVLTCTPLGGGFSCRNIELFPYVAAVRSLAIEADILVCDIFQSFAEYSLTTNGPSALFIDGQHLNVLGHWLMVMNIAPFVSSP